MTQVLTDQDLEELPEVVQRYLRFMGVVDQPVIDSFRGRFVGRFRLKPGGRWMSCRAWQSDTADPISRSFRMRLLMGGLLPVIGVDTYEAGTGRMRARALGLFTVADAAGPELDLGELTTYLDDALLYAPAMLIGPAVTWRGVDDRTFSVSIEDSGLTSTARVVVDDRGAPREVSSDDRYASLGDRLVRARWRTPVDGWTTVGGRSVPAAASAIWDLSDGPYTYAVGCLEPGTLQFGSAI